MSMSWILYQNTEEPGFFAKPYSATLILVSAVEVIEMGPCVCRGPGCGTYIVHHGNGTELRCAPLGCIVHH